MNKHSFSTTALLSSGFLLILSFVSCNKDDSEELRANEKRLRDSYIQSHNITTTPKNSGLYYIESTAGTGIQPINGDLVRINFTMMNLDEKALYTTVESIAHTGEIYSATHHYGPERWIINLESNQLTGLMEGITLMKENGTATLITPSEITFKNNGLGNVVQPYETLLWNVQLVEVIKNPALYEHNLLVAYLDTVQREIDSTSDGIVKIIDKVGTGDLPAVGTTIKVLFKLYLMDGWKVAQITTPYSHNVGTTEGLITGWDKAMRTIRLGEKCRVILPYDEAYGANGQEQIPPYSTIIYQFERTE
jgi:FKBP-type peptidyl-prolyl cis-trans isomerase FkpA